MRKNSLLGIILALFLSLHATASEPKIIQSFWMAFNSGDKMLTNMDVEDYICVTNLSDEMMITLFRQAEGDYNRYQTLRRAWAQARFNDGLRQFAYIYAMQKMATNKFWNKNGRKAFTITESDYFDRVQDFESAALKKWLDERQGIVKARKAFGALLKEQGFPHKKDISDTDLYFEWFDLQKERIKESMRIEELRKYEYMAALGDYRTEFRQNPIEISDFQRDVSAKIQGFNGSRMTADQLAEEIASDDRIPVLMKNAEFFSPDTVALAKLKEEAPEVFNDFKRNIENSAFESFDNQLVADINRYEGIVATLVEKHKTSDKLNELAQEMKKQFILGTGDFNHFMMARLYTMAAIKVTQGNDFKANNINEAAAKANYLTALMAQAKTIATDALNSPQELGKVRLEDHFIQAINENPVDAQSKEILDSDEYLNEYKKMVHWVVKFQFKKAALNVTPKVVIDEYSRSEYKRYDRVKNYLLQKTFNEDLDRFRHETARRRVPYMRIQLAPGAEGEVQDSWDFVLEKFPRRS